MSLLYKLVSQNVGITLGSSWLSLKFVWSEDISCAAVFLPPMRSNQLSHNACLHLTHFLAACRKLMVCLPVCLQQAHFKQNFLYISRQTEQLFCGNLSQRPSSGCWSVMKFVEERCHNYRNAAAISCPNSVYRRAVSSVEMKILIWRHRWNPRTFEVSSIIIKNVCGVLFVRRLVDLLVGCSAGNSSVQGVG